MVTEQLPYPGNLTYPLPIPAEMGILPQGRTRVEGQIVL